MNRNRKILLVIITLLLAGIALALAFMTRDSRPASIGITPSASPTSTPALTRSDQELLERLSREFAGKYLSYKRPDSGEYLNSIKPYMTSELHTKVALENQKAARFPDIPSVTTSVGSVTFATNTERVADMKVDGQSSTSDNQSYEESLTFRWEKRGERWVVVSLNSDGSLQNREKYGE